MNITVVRLVDREYPLPPDADYIYVFPGHLTLRSAAKAVAALITKETASTWDSTADVENGPSPDDIPPTMTDELLLGLYEVFLTTTVVYGL